MSNIFPKSANKLPLQIIIYLVVLAGIATAGVTYYMTPKYTRIGYAPVQPVPFSHAKHVSELGLDCRYCHSFVDVSGHSNVPTGNTCWNCHQHVQKDSPKLEPLHVSMNPAHPRYDGKPIECLQALDRDRRVIYTGTASKLLFPALRIGWLVEVDRLDDPQVVKRTPKRQHHRRHRQPPAL